MKVSERMYPVSLPGILEVTLENENGMSVSVLNYGGIITGIRVPDRGGDIANVVLSYMDPEDYLDNPGYFGAIIGRTAGRIKDAYFDLGGRRYFLAKNYGENSGHGGESGFDRKVFLIEPESGNNEGRVHLTCGSPHMEEGYPGELKVHVTYTLTEDNTFRIDYEAESDQDTLVNLTNHSYFNLSGDFRESIENHMLQIDASRYAELDLTSAPTGVLADTAGGPFDFMEMKPIGRDIRLNHPQLLIGKGYDHPFLFDSGQEDKVRIRLAHEPSGRTLEVLTDNEAVVFYSQNYTQGQIIQDGRTLPERKSVALEVQRLPIGAQGAFAEHSMLEKGQTYHTFTAYRFGVE
jgi:aldose 1-epimerase